MASAAVVGILRALLTADSAEFETAMKRGAESAKVLTRDLKTTGQQMSSIGSAMTKTFTLPLVAVGAAVTKLAIDFESSFAGVRKTVDGTEPEFAAMAASFRALSKEIPINVNEINRLGEAAGALGIPKQEIVEFARVMALLGVTTNVTSEQAAESIAKIQNIFGAAGKDTDRFAATLVALGNDGASTEAQILELANRIASAGNAIGLTQGQVLGFASAIANVGIEAEAGGSAISRVFIDISQAVSEGGSALEEFARIADVSAADYAKAFKIDAAGATKDFIEGLGRIKKEGGDLNKTLNDLGFTELRQANLLRSLALSGKNVADSLELQSKAWTENTALTTEAGKRFETTESRLTLLWNRIKNVGITIGDALKPAIDLAIAGLTLLIPVIEHIAKQFADAPAIFKLAAVGLAAVVAAAGPVIFAFGQLAISASALTTAFTAKGVVMTALTGKSAALTGALTVLGRAAAVAGAAFVGWQLGRLIEQHDALRQSISLLVPGLSSIEINRQNAIRDLSKVTEAHKAEMIALAQSKGVTLQATDATKRYLEAVDALQKLETIRQAQFNKSIPIQQAAIKAELELGRISQQTANERLAALSVDEKVLDVGKKRIDINVAIGLSEKKIQDEIKATGYTAAELTAKLKTNEEGFKAYAKQVGLSDETVKFLTDSMKKGSKAVDAHAEAVKHLVDAFTKKNIADEIILTAKAVSQLTDEQRKNLGSSPEFIRQLDNWARTGQKIPPILADIQRSSITAFFQRLAAEQKPVVDFFNSVNVAAADVALMLPRAEGAVTDFFNSVKAATPDDLFTFRLPDGGEKSDFLKLLEPPAQARSAWADLSGIIGDLSDHFVDLGRNGSAAMQMLTRHTAGFARSMAQMGASKEGFSSGAIGGAVVTMGWSLMYEWARMKQAEDLQTSATVASQLDEIRRLQQELGRHGVTVAGATNFQRDSAVWLAQLGALNNVDDVMATLNLRMEHYRRQLDQVIGREAKLAEVRARMTTDLIGNFGQLLDLGGQLPASMQGAIDQLLTMGQISQETRDALMGLDDGPDWRAVQAMAEEYGVAISALGPAFQEQRLAETGINIARAWAAMAQPGADINAILNEMDDEVQDVIDSARTAAVAIPASMRPIIEKMIELGLLTGADGELLRDMSEIEFSTDLEESIGDLVAVIRDLLEALGLIPSAAYTANQALKDMTPWTGPGPQPPQTKPLLADIPVSAVTAPGFAYVRPGDIVGMPSLSNLGGQSVTSSGGMTVINNISAWDAQSVESWLRRGGDRILATGIAPRLPDALRPFGVTRR